MAYVVKPDPATGIVVVSVDGAPGLEEVTEALRELWGTAAFRARPWVLWDLRNADLSGLRAASLRRIASLEIEERPPVPRSRAALVVAREVDFGVLRMLEAFLPADAMLDYRIFRDPDAAWGWLRG